VTVKLALLDAVPFTVVTVIGPIVAPDGTVAVIEVLLLTVRVATVLTLSMVNGLKLVLLVPVPALVVTEIGPAVAPAGTIAEIEVLLLTSRVATFPLNVTIAPLAKPVPVIPTDVSIGAAA
jgi:hypothetical protein